MQTVFFTDPHIGVNRLSHTNTVGRQRLREAIYRQAMAVAKLPNCGKFCLGDLFDTHANDEEVIRQGADIIKEGVNVLGGNHDLPNREGKVSSLQLLAAIMPRNGLNGDIFLPTEGYVRSVRVSGAVIYMVPHTMTQDLFEESLWEAEAMAKRAGSQEVKILCLHCNYDNPYEHTDASLNLSPEQAERLLGAFNFVLLGHEHTSRRLHDGRLIVLGNTFPTSFSDLSDKYYWTFDGVEFVRHLIWSKSLYHARYSWEDLLNRSDSGPWPDLHFVEVAGTAPSSKLPEIAEAVAKLWKSLPNLLMVRNMVVSEMETVTIQGVTYTAMELPDKVSAALEGSELLLVWQQYLERVDD